MAETDLAPKIEQIIGAYQADQRFALAALQDMQHAFNYTPAEGLERLAAYLGCPESQLYSMATFTRLFRSRRRATTSSRYAMAPHAICADR